jgi:hypothetical protein
MASCFHTLLSERSRWQEVVADPSLVQKAWISTLLDRLPSLPLVPGHELQRIPAVQVVPVVAGLVVEWDR